MNYVGGELGLFSRALGWKRYVRSTIRGYIGARVLEVGAGIGGTTRVLAGGGETSWTCLEPDEGQCAAILTLIGRGELPPHCDVVRGEVGDLAREALFDTVLYMDVLEHIADDAGELRRAAGHLAPGGRLVVLSPAHQGLYSEFDAAIGHYRRYDARTLSAAGPIGARLIRADYLDSVGLLLSMANRLVLKQSMPTEKQVLFWDRFVIPLSRIADRVLFHRIGKSVLCVWQKGEET